MEQIFSLEIRRNRQQKLSTLSFNNYATGYLLYDPEKKLLRMLSDTTHF
jgi:hypothetical protein